MAKDLKISNDSYFSDWMKRIKLRIRESQLKAAVRVNTELLRLYWDLGKDIVQRASAFLLLKDSKASFTIEGESPKSKRAARWGTAIGQAGLNDLSKEELTRLQQLVIENTRFVQMGLRKRVLS